MNGDNLLFVGVGGVVDDAFSIYFLSGANRFRK